MLNKVTKHLDNSVYHNGALHALCCHSPELQATRYILLTCFVCLCLQVLAVAVHNHYKRLQNKRMHRAVEHAAQQQAAMVSVQGSS